MRSGKWLVNPNSIGFDTDGWIIDGANRLRACVKSGVSFETRVTVDNPPECFSVTDAGWHRSHSQMFAIAGYKNSALSSSIAFTERQYGSGWTPVRPSSDELLDWASPRFDDVVSAAHWGRKAGLDAKPWFTATLLGWMYWKLRDEAGSEWAADFLDRLVTGEDLRGGDPRMALRRQMQRQLAARMAGKGDPKPTKVEMQALLVITHNKWVDGETNCKRISLPARVVPSKKPPTPGGKDNSRGKDKIREKKSRRSKDSWPQLRYK